MTTQTAHRAIQMSPEQQAYLDRLNEPVTLEEFKQKFDFQRHKPWSVAVREQMFLLSESETAALPADEFLKRAQAMQQAKEAGSGWQFALTNYQVNFRTSFVSNTKLKQLESELRKAAGVREVLAKQFAWKYFTGELADMQVPKVFHKTPAYQRLALRTDEALLHTATRTCSTCIEVVMPNLETALKASNRMGPHVSRLAASTSAARHKYWERLQKLSGLRAVAEPFNSVEHFYQVCESDGCQHDPMAMPYVVNISPHGYLRMDCFGNTHDPKIKMSWVKQVLSILAPLM